MKKVFILVVMTVLFISCNEKPDDRKSPDGPESKANGSLMLTGMMSLKGSEIVSVNLDSGVVVATPIDCFSLSSTVYDPKTGGYGYVDCDSCFRMVDATTGNSLMTIRLPGVLSNAVIDTIENTLIGMYIKTTYIHGHDTSTTDDTPVFSNRFIKIDMDNGKTLSDVEADLGNGIYLCSSYYDTRKKAFVMERSDQKLITINPVTGIISKEVYLGRALYNAEYNPDDNQLIALTFDSESGKNFVEIIDPETGSAVSKKEVMIGSGVHYCISGYDRKNGYYIAFNAENQLLYIDVHTGEIRGSYKMEEPLYGIRIWRSRLKN